MEDFVYFILALILTILVGPYIQDAIKRFIEICFTEINGNYEKRVIFNRTIIFVFD